MLTSTSLCCCPGCWTRRSEEEKGEGTAGLRCSPLARKPAECQQAALEAIAVARGLPRWRQYAKLNVEHWTDHAAYRTRFDGTLDEDTLFAQAATLGAEAETVYTACGGAADAPTTPVQEQSFHTCW